MALQQSTKKISKVIPKILLRNVPLTATPADVRRAIFREEVKDVTDVQIDYRHFRPTGQAVITLGKSEHMEANAERLRKVTIDGIQLAPSTRRDTSDTPIRSRGVEGRAEAAQRGIISGDGPSGGLSGTERMITIWGTPGKTEAHDIAKLLQAYKVVKSTKGASNKDSKDTQYDIHKILPPKNEFSMHSRFIVRLESEAEAHRVVRDLHKTPWVLSGRSRSNIYARVLY